MNRVKLGLRIKHLREERGLTQLELAEKVGYTAAMVSIIEKGKSAISETKLCKIADVLEIDVKELCDPTRDSLTDSLAELRSGATEPAPILVDMENPKAADAVEATATSMMAEAMDVYNAFMRLNPIQQDMVRSMVNRTEEVINNEN